MKRTSCELMLQTAEISAKCAKCSHLVLNSVASMALKCRFDHVKNTTVSISKALSGAYDA